MKFNSGIEFGMEDYVEFKVEKVERKYLVVEVLNMDYMEDIYSFCNRLFVSTCGKYEVERFIAKRLFTDIAVKKDISDLMNMTVYFNDMPYNETLIEPAYIRSIVMKYFEIISSDVNTVYLRYVGKK